MSFLEILADSVKGMLPGLLYWLVFPMVPFIIAEQLRPVATAPRLRDYWTNLLVSFSTAYLSLPLGISAALLSGKLHHLLPWKPLSWSFHSIAAVPVVGHGVELFAMIFVPLFIHDCWFYWSHRIEHRLPVLWQFHQLHHSDELMNTTTWARDHFLQEGWRAFFFRLHSRPFRRLKTSRSGESSALFHDVSRGTLHVLSLGHSHSSAVA